FSLARADQITQAISRVSEYLREVYAEMLAVHPKSEKYFLFSTRRTADIWKAVRFIGDYPEEYRGNIVNLAGRSIRWHNSGQAQEQHKAIASFGAEKRVAKPPVPLPEKPGVSFLSTVGEICDEGAKMHHCIASYAQRAVNGFCYLFHIDHDGDMASV